MTRLHLIFERFRGPTSVTLKETELCLPPEIGAAITEGKTVQEIPKYVNTVEMFELPEAISAYIESDKPIEPKRKRLEVREWRAQVCVPDIAGALDYAVTHLENECRREFARYHRIFLGNTALKMRIDRLLTWSLRSKLRYWWLRLTGRSVNFQTFPGHNEITYTVLVRAAVE